MWERINAVMDTFMIFTYPISVQCVDSKAKERWVYLLKDSLGEAELAYFGAVNRVRAHKESVSFVLGYIFKRMKTDQFVYHRLYIHVLK